MPDREEELFGRIVDAARSLGVTEIEAIIGSEYEALTRFANNTIHQNVAERGSQISVRLSITSVPGGMMPITSRGRPATSTV